MSVSPINLILLKSIFRNYPIVSENPEVAFHCTMIDLGDGMIVFRIIFDDIVQVHRQVRSLQGVNDVKWTLSDGICYGYIKDQR